MVLHSDFLKFFGHRIIYIFVLQVVRPETLINKEKAILEVQVEDSNLVVLWLSKPFCDLVSDPAGVTRPFTV